MTTIRNNKQLIVHLAHVATSKLNALARRRLSSKFAQCISPDAFSSRFMRLAVGVSK